MTRPAPLTFAELMDALKRLSVASGQIGEIPEPVVKLLHDMLVERDQAAARIARSLKEMVKG